MKIIGLTGGIGSGKTTVASFFKELGVPVYIADIEAKRILATSKVVRRKVIALLGENAFTDQGPDKAYIASKIFNDALLLEKMNRIIHPKVGSHFKRWVKKQESAYVIKEAAVLFENDGYKNCDATILVTAPLKVRIERVMKRDDVSAAKVEERIKNQWSDEDKAKLATFIIENIDLIETKLQVSKLHKKLLNLS